MEQRIVCPNCEFEIEVAQALSAQISDKIRLDLEAEFQQKTKQIDHQRQILAQETNKLAEDQREFEARLKLALEQQKQQTAPPPGMLPVHGRQAVFPQLLIP